MALPPHSSPQQNSFSPQQSTLILGCGGHARVLASALSERGIELQGAIDPGYSVGSAPIKGVIVRGSSLEELHQAFRPETCQLVNGIGYLGTHDRRRLNFQLAKELGYRFPIVSHPSVVIGQNCTIDAGVQLMAGVILQPGVTLGQNTIVNTSTSIDHDCQVMAHCHIAPGVRLAGQVHIGEHTLIGIGSIVIQGISIGANTLVGAGSVVIRPLPDNVVAVGNPAQVIRKR